MPKYTLGACTHRRTAGYGKDGNGYFTCLLCFRRFMFVRREDSMQRDAVPAPAWDGQCLHIASFLNPLDSAKGRPDRAHCTNCGCVVEHPPGPGKWTPVVFYGYLIREETVPSLADWS
jgi:hypothetical protein